MRQRSRVAQRPGPRSVMADPPAAGPAAGSTRETTGGAAYAISGPAPEKSMLLNETSTARASPRRAGATRGGASAAGSPGAGARAEADTPAVTRCPRGGECASRMTATWRYQSVTPRPASPRARRRPMRRRTDRPRRPTRARRRRRGSPRVAGAACAAARRGRPHPRAAARAAERRARRRRVHDAHPVGGRRRERLPPMRSSAQCEVGERRCARRAAPYADAIAWAASAEVRRSSLRLCRATPRRSRRRLRRGRRVFVVGGAAELYAELGGARARRQPSARCSGACRARGVSRGRRRRQRRRRASHVRVGVGEAVAAKRDDRAAEERHHGDRECAP